MDDTCALDVADRGPATLEEIGNCYGVVRERIRQVETKALVKLKRAAKKIGMEDAPESPLHHLVAGFEAGD